MSKDLNRSISEYEIYVRQTKGKDILDDIRKWALRPAKKAKVKK